MATQLPVTIQSGEGCYVFDTEGKRYLDMISGIGVNALGYAHPRITAAIVEQAARCVHVSNLVSHPYREPLAERLCEISGLHRVLFTNSGTEAMEAAMKAIRFHARSPKKRIVALKNSFHGRSRGALAVLGQPELRNPFGPYVAPVTFIEPNDEEALTAAIDRDTAAVVMETVQGEGGIYPLSTSFLQLARELTTNAGALLVLDEVQCGLGRTGRYFAYQWAGIQPDIVTVAKPLAAGLPLGAAILSESVSDLFPACAHGSTFAAGPLACRVALEFLCILDDLLPRVRETAGFLRSGLEELKQRHPVVTEIRAKGMMFGLQLSEPGNDLVLKALDRGMLLNCTHDTVLRLLPPLIISHNESREALHLLDEILP